MPPALSSYVRAVRSLATPGMPGVMIGAVLLTFFVLIGFVVGASTLFIWAFSHSANAFVAHYLPWLGSLGAVLFAWALFPGIMPVIVNGFGNRIVGLIERHDYPEAPLQPSAFWSDLRHDLSFSLFTIAANIVALPFYFIPGLGIILFFWLNGYLLGREFFVMVGRRHIALAEAEALRKSHEQIVTLTGALLTLLATIPIVNFFAPFWGVAAMTHLYHKLAKPAPELLPPNKPLI